MQPDARVEPTGVPHYARGPNPKLVSIPASIGRNSLPGPKRSILLPTFFPVSRLLRNGLPASSYWHVCRAGGPVQAQSVSIERSPALRLRYFFRSVQSGVEARLDTQACHATNMSIDGHRTRTASRPGARVIQNMATPETQEAAAKQRIIRHMNADHHDSIRRYVEAYASRSPRQSHSAQMTDIDLTQMKFNCGGQTSVVAFDPPMKSLREARERLVQMDKNTLQILGRSDITVTTYVPPYIKLGHLFNFTQCSLTLLLLPRGANFRPGSLLYDSLLFMVPAFARFVLQVRWIVLLLMLAIHIVESFIMANKVKRHGLSSTDAVWWLWVGSSFVEGVTAFWRLDGLIAEKQQAKDAKKH
ncbi:hypothetical protein OPT61_g3740 [Boeremia exigua]|uniref:Uncharacterized protein n=1 Tax=Boeremia exigua TaxID=749465 RepID=A0ACC2IGP5_9PLEO|nr:hypothetical protein OPT61_g3740 [Boeremia exigua]